MSVTMQATDSLTLDEALVSARVLADNAAGRRLEGESLRRLPDDTMAELVDSGLLRMNQAKRWGGLELGNEAVVELVSAVAEGDGASGWVFGLLASHFWLGSAFGLEAQNDMWGEDPTAMMSSSFAAQESQVEAVPGGFKVSGRWPFSSGSDHCRWAMVGIVVMPGDGAGPPFPRWCLVPRPEYTVDDTWKTCALRGTGSNTLVLDEVFIPEHRTVDPVLLMSGQAPGAEVNPSPIFRLSFSTALSWYLGSAALGAATRTVRDFADYSSKKRSKFTGELEINDAMIIHVGTASAQVEAARSVMRYRTRFLDEVLAGGQVPTFDQALASNRDATSAVRICVDAVELCMRFSGGSGLFESHTVQQGWRDVHGVAAHMGYNTDTVYGNWGRHILGLALPPGFA